MSPVDSLSLHIRSHRVPEPGRDGVCLGLLFIAIVFCIFNDFRGIKNGWRDPTPCRIIQHLRAGLPLAEQSAHRYWRGVEGRTVLNP
jgi:hypothetical protein